MKLLIFFLIFLLLFTPTGIAEEETNYTMLITFVDSTGEPIVFINTTTYKIGLWNNNGQIGVDTFSNKTLDFNSIQDKITCERKQTKNGFIKLYSSYDIPYDNYTIRSDFLYVIDEDLGKLRVMVTEPVQTIQFHNKSVIHPVLAHEVEGKPETFSLYDLAKQSEKTSNHSWWLSFFALIIALINIYYIKEKIIWDVKTKYQRFNNSQVKDKLEYILIIILSLSISYSGIYRIIYDIGILNLWISDILLTVSLGVLLVMLGRKQTKRG